MSTSRAPRRFAIAAMILLLLSILPLGPSTQAAFHGNMGTFVTAPGDKDFVPLLSTAPGGTLFCFGFIEDSAFPGDASKYAWFFHVATDGACTAGTTTPVAQRSWLITGFGGTPQQKWIVPADTQYTSRTFTGIESLAGGPQWVCYLESDGIDGYSIGDVLVVKNGFSLGATQPLAVNDLRISAVSTTTLTPFSASVGIVKSADQDLTRAQQSGSTPPTADPSRLPVNTTMQCGGFTASFLNLGSLDLVNSQDIFYLVHGDLLTSAFVYPGMLRITSTTGVTGHGQKVLAANNDVKRGLQAPVATTLNLVVVDPGLGDILDTSLAIKQANHPAGGNTLIRMHDIFVKRGTGHAASSPGTLATSAPSGTQIGVGSTVSSSTALAAQIYYIDTGVAGFSPEDPIYIRHPDSAGGTGVRVGDVRVNVPGQTAGSMVRSSDADFLQHQGATPVFGFQLKLHSERDDTRMPLKAVANGKFVGASTIWDPTMDNVFITTATTVTDGLAVRQVWTNAAGGAPLNTARTFNCSDPGGLGPDAECGQTLRATSHLKTTGETATWLVTGEGQGDRLYWSEDNFLTVGDYRLGHGALSTNHNPATGPVLAGQADVAPGALFQSSGVTLFASQHTGFAHPTAGDVQIFPSFGTRWTHATTGAVPMTMAAPFELVRAELGDTGGLLGSVYYLDFSPSSFTPGRALRMTAFDGKPAGSFVQSGDTIEIQATKFRTGHANDADHFGYIDNAPTGLDPNEFVYLNLPAVIGGSAGQSLTQWDSRITPVAHGASTYAAGTVVQSGNTDLQSFQGNTLLAAGTGANTGTASVIWWDANLNGVVDAGDALWLRLRTGPPASVPTFLDVRLNGAPATAPGSPGTGGGTPSQPAPPVPALSGGLVMPEFVQQNGVQTFQVTYTHGAGTAPTTRNVIIDGASFPMTASTTTYATGALFTMPRTATTAGEQSFHFEFVAGGTTVRFPSTGSLTAYVGPAENVAPTLSAGTPPEMSGAPGSSFTFEAIYKDANNNAPVNPQVHLEWNPTRTLDLTCEGTTYYKGVPCSATTTLSDPGAYRYHFTVSDGTHDGRHPATGTLAGPTVTDPGEQPPTTTDGDGVDDEDENGTPGPALILVLLAVFGHVVWRARRRNQ